MPCLSNGVRGSTLNELQAPLKSLVLRSCGQIVYKDVATGLNNEQSTALRCSGGHEIRPCNAAVSPWDWHSLSGWSRAPPNCNRHSRSRWRAFFRPPPNL